MAVNHYGCIVTMFSMSQDISAGKTTVMMSCQPGPLISGFHGTPDGPLEVHYAVQDGSLVLISIALLKLL